jgi:MFS family permease
MADSRVGPVTTLFIVLFLMGSSILAIWTVSTSLGLLLLFMLVNGSCSGALISLQPPVAAALFGMQDMVATMSMVTMSRAFGAALGGPIAGYILDAFGGPGGGVAAYRPALFITGGLSMLSASLVGALRWKIAGLRLWVKV